MKSYGGFFDLDAKNKEIEKLEFKMAQPGFWDDSSKAQGILKKRKALALYPETWNKLYKQCTDTKELLEMLDEEDKASLEELKKDINNISVETSQFEVKIMLSGEHDGGNAFLTIHPGAGGTESQDWAEILLRMYLRWCERKGFKSSIIDYQPGEEAGVKSVTIEIKGDFVYGYLKAERGVHRLVRISPFDSNKRRHTSFASVHTFPEIDDDINIEIDEKDLKIDTYRSSGAGGQHVNKTDSAIRITHIPTGIVVSCQNERSQHKNKNSAMKVLKSRLYEVEKDKQKEKLNAIETEKKDIAWGSQIRSYVLHPYRMVKDTRTKIESGKVDAVLDGDIDTFIETYLMHSIETQGVS